MDTKLRAFVFGYSGGVGKSIVAALANEPKFEKVTLFGRRVIDLQSSTSDPKPSTGDFSKFTQEIIDFDKLSEYSDKLKGFHVGFYTLGASPFKVSSEEFKKISQDYTMTVARMASENGIKHFHYMSGALVKKNAMLAGSRLLAEVVEELEKVDFLRLSIYRPAIILTDDNNGGMSGKFGVTVARVFDRFHWISIEAEVLGKFVVANCFTSSTQKIETFSNKDIQDWEKQEMANAK